MQRFVIPECSLGLPPDREARKMEISVINLRLAAA
jgi:hypothetical protein